MAGALTLFVAGLGGVFIGMAVLYLAIRATSLITERLTSGEEKSD